MRHELDRRYDLNVNFVVLRQNLHSMVMVFVDRCTHYANANAYVRGYFVP